MRQWKLWSATALALLPFFGLTVHAKSGDDFSDNLFTDLGPLLALFGEQFAKQFMSQSMGWFDCIIFALLPLGVLTAVVSAIRIGGPSWLKAIIGRARENRAIAELEVMSSTSHEVCELWNGVGIVRTIGRPHIAQIIYLEEYSDNVKTCGLYRLGFLEDEETHVFHSRECADPLLGMLFRQSSSATQSGRSDEEASSETSATPLNLQEEEIAPNISLNLHGLANSKDLSFATLIGVVVQAGILIFAGYVSYDHTFEDGLPSAEETTKGHAFPLFAVGTFFLSLGMLFCAQIVDESTEEREYVHPEGSGKKLGARILWVQRKENVGDQTFDAYVTFGRNSGADDTLDRILTSRRAFDKRVDDTASDNSGGKKLFATRSELITILGTTFGLIGFILQFQGLRSMNWLVSIAQLCGIFVMTALRAWLRRGMIAVPISARVLDLHELDWLSVTLCGGSESASLYRDNSTAWETSLDRAGSVASGNSSRMFWPKNSCDGSLMGHIQWAVSDTFASDSNLEVGNRGLQHAELEADQSVNSALRLLRVRQRLGALTNWTGPVSEVARTVSKSIGIVMDTIVQDSHSFTNAHRQDRKYEAEYDLYGYRELVEEDELGNWHDEFTSAEDFPGSVFRWCIPVNITVIDPSTGRKVTRSEKVPLCVIKDSPANGGRWRMDATAVEAALSLWLLGLREIELAKGAARKQGEDWLVPDRSSKVTYDRYIGSDDDPYILRDIAWWIYSGTGSSSVEPMSGGCGDEPDVVEIGYKEYPPRITESEVSEFEGSRNLGLHENESQGCGVGASGKTPTHFRVRSQGVLETVLGQHVFMAFMMEFARTLNPQRLAGDELEEAVLRQRFPDDSSEDYEDVDDSFSKFRLKNKLLSRITDAIQKTGLATSEEALLCMVPFLSYYRKLPMEPLFNQVRADMQKYELVGQWTRVIPVYLRLFEECRHLGSVGSDLLLKAIAMIIEAHAAYTRLATNMNQLWDQEYPLLLQYIGQLKVALLDHCHPDVILAFMNAYLQADSFARHGFSILSDAEENMKLCHGVGYTFKNLESTILTACSPQTSELCRVEKPQPAPEADQEIQLSPVVNGLEPVQSSSLIESEDTSVVHESPAIWSGDLQSFFRRLLDNTRTGIDDLQPDLRKGHTESANAQGHKVVRFRDPVEIEELSEWNATGQSDSGDETQRTENAFMSASSASTSGFAPARAPVNEDDIQALLHPAYYISPILSSTWRVENDEIPSSEVELPPLYCDSGYTPRMACAECHDVELHSKATTRCAAVSYRGPGFIKPAQRKYYPAPRRRRSSEDKPVPALISSPFFSEPTQKQLQSPQPTGGDGNFSGQPTFPEAPRYPGDKMLRSALSAPFFRTPVDYSGLELQPRAYFEADSDTASTVGQVGDPGYGFLGYFLVGPDFIQPTTGLRIRQVNDRGNADCNGLVLRHVKATWDLEGEERAEPNSEPARSRSPSPYRWRSSTEAREHKIRRSVKQNGHLKPTKNAKMFVRPSNDVDRLYNTPYGSEEALEFPKGSGFGEVVGGLSADGDTFPKTSGKGEVLEASGGYITFAELGRPTTITFLRALGITPLHKRVISMTGFRENYYALGKLTRTMLTDSNSGDVMGYTPLHYVAQGLLYGGGSKSQLETLIKELGCLPWVAGRDGRTPLHIAAKLGNFTMLEVLLQLHTSRSTAAAYADVQDWMGQTALHWAATNVHSGDVASLLLDNGASTGIRNSQSQTALYLAIEHHSFECVEEILKFQQASEVTPMELLNAMNRIGRHRWLWEDTDRDLADSENHGQHYQYPSSKSNSRAAKPPYPDMSLTSSSRDLILRLVAEYMFANDMLLVEDEQGNTVAHRYASRRLRASDKLCSNVFEALLRTGGVDLMRKNHEGKTPLHIAAEEQDLDMVRLFLGNGAKIGIRDAFGMTCLHRAVQNTPYTGRGSDLMLLCFLLANFVGGHSLGPSRPESKDVQGILESRDAAGWTVVHHAVDRHQYNTLGALLRFGCKADAYDYSGRSIFHVAVQSSKPYSCGESLIKTAVRAGADINSRDGKFGRTALFYALDIHSIYYLVKYGADVNAMDATDDTPLLVAVRRDNNSQVIATLLALGAEPNIQESKGTFLGPLHYAAMANSVAVIDYLLQSGARVDLRDANGRTPLLLAAVTGRLEAVKYLLLDGGADITAVDCRGMSALDLARARNKSDIVSFLLQVQEVWNEIRSESTGSLSPDEDLTDLEGYLEQDWNVLSDTTSIDRPVQPPLDQRARAESVSDHSESVGDIEGAGLRTLVGPDEGIQGSKKEASLSSDAESEASEQAGACGFSPGTEGPKCQPQQTELQSSLAQSASSDCISKISSATNIKEKIERMVHFLDDIDLMRDIKPQLTANTSNWTPLSHPPGSRLTRTDPDYPSISLSHLRSFNTESEYGAKIKLRLGAHYGPPTAEEIPDKGYGSLLVKAWLETSELTTRYPIVGELEVSFPEGYKRFVDSQVALQLLPKERKALRANLFTRLTVLERAVRIQQEDIHTDRLGAIWLLRAMHDLDKVRIWIIDENGEATLKGLGTVEEASLCNMPDWPMFPDEPALERMARIMIARNPGLQLIGTPGGGQLTVWKAPSSTVVPQGLEWNTSQVPPNKEVQLGDPVEGPAGTGAPETSSPDRRVELSQREEAEVSSDCRGN